MREKRLFSGRKKMPCYEPREHPERMRAGLENENERLQKELDERTRMLCEAMVLTERLSTYGNEHMCKYSSELRKWWQAHKKWDAAREAKDVSKTFEVDNGRLKR